MSIEPTSWRDGGAPWQFLAGPEATGGTFLFGEARLDPGAAVPGLHQHQHEDESLYVVEGTLTVEVGGERVELQAGQFLMLPRGVPHRFGNLSDRPVRVVGAIAPAGIERMFEEQSAYFATLQGPPDDAVIDEIGARYGVTRLGPPLS